MDDITEDPLPRSLLQIRGVLTRRASGFMRSPRFRSRTSNPNLGAIIGGTVAGVALVVLGIVFFLFLRRRSCVRLSETVALYQSVGVTTPEPRNITGGPKGHSFNTVNTVPNQVQAPLPDQPVEAGLMSSPMCSNFPSEGSRSRRTLMFG